MIAATNKDLSQLIEKDMFREDLFFRLNVVPIPSPALRDRADDIPILVEHFTNLFCDENNFRKKSISAEALEFLKKQPWKGNIRELKNLVERTLILSDGDTISPSDFSESESSHFSRAGVVSSASTLKEFKEQMERMFLINKLQENNWNVLRTAKNIDTPRSNLYKKIEQYGISRKKQN